MLVSYFRFGAGCHQISRCRKRDKLGRAAHTPFAGPHFHDILFPYALKSVHAPEAGKEFMIVFQPFFEHPGHFFRTEDGEILIAAFRSQQRRLVVLNILHI